MSLSTTSSFRKLSRAKGVCAGCRNMSVSLTFQHMCVIDKSLAYSLPCCQDSQLRDQQECAQDTDAVEISKVPLG